MNIKKPEDISTKFVYACMGFGGCEPDEASIELVKQCSQKILSVAEPRATFNTFNMGYTDSQGDVFVGNKNYLLKGKDVKKHLAGCSSCVLMAVTLGMQVDKLIRRTQVTDMTKAVAMDACASSLIEDICDKINEQLEKEFFQQGLGLISRFSPGYGDLPLETQSVFSELLEMEKKIGLTRSRDNLLLPRKSVTAVIGILPLKELDDRKFAKAKKPCEICSIRVGCTFRINGGHCGMTKENDVDKDGGN